ncbi:hypothetical protein WI372_02215 [Gemmatimonadota bacterium DH-20]|uniref:6-bladed beta-propeller n=2 Tax=Gaopeijia maritima TaxID=3119007 RepID=A0ABU9E753_9BACT
MALTFAFYAACTPADRSTRRQSGDTTFVYSAAPQRDTATLREVLRIGTAEGDPNDMFSGISAFSVASNGQVYVAEFEGNLRQFDSTGQFVGEVARQGQGPGEVLYVIGLDVNAGGDVAALDLGNRRVSFFDSVGNSIGQLRLPDGRPAYGRDALRWDIDGDLWLGINPVRAALEPDYDYDLRPIFGRIVAGGQVEDTVFLEATSDECHRRDPVHARGMYEDFRIGFLPFYHWSRSPNGTVAVGCAANYSFDLRYPDGRVLRVERAWQPALMESDEQAHFLMYHDAAPRNRPAFLRVWLGEKGRIWARPGTAGHPRSATPAERSAGYPEEIWDAWVPTDGMDVFEPGGAWLGHVRTPPNWVARPFPGLADPQFMGDTIWAVTTDELGVEYLSKFVVEWPGILELDPRGADRAAESG